MKVTINIDCTPEEARTFLGLPDIAPMQQRMLAEMEARMQKAVAGLEPEALLANWLPAGVKGVEQMQKAMWSAFSGDKKSG